jgi:type II secretory pathway pseudopilin PulG
MACIQSDVLKNEKGFTLIELLMASVLSILMVALVAGIFESQNNTFVLQNQLNKMQVNGRGATEFLSRAVQNSGYNVFRGTRFLAASDHYLTTVYDQDNDGVIQNDEVMTFAVGNTFSSVNETFNIDPFFDMDQNGAVEGTETATYPITMTLTSPPYNLYKVIPDNSGGGITRHTVARNLDNLIVRYYDKNGDLLPAGIDLDDDGIPDTGSYVVPLAELNDIRKVDIEVIARTRDEDPRSEFNSAGTFLAGSVATQGGGTYSDGYHRQTFTAYTSPRNLVMAPWGKMDIVASPPTVNCPATTSTVTATLVDSNGSPVASGANINFAVNGGGSATVSPLTGTTNSLGEATATVTYDWSSPNASITISASSLITVGGKQNPVFNAGSVNFQSGTGIFTDNFDDGDSNGWTEVGATNWNVAAGQYRTASNGNGISVNGCDPWQNYEMQIDTQRNGSLGTGEYTGMILRYQNSNQYYMARIYCELCTGPPTGHIYKLQIVDYDSGETVLAASAAITFDNNTLYTLKASVDAGNLNMKIWETAATEPGGWTITATDASYTQGKVGLATTKNVSVFDNVAVNPL